MVGLFGPPVYMDMCLSFYPGEPVFAVHNVGVVRQRSSLLSMHSPHFDDHEDRYACVFRLFLFPEVGIFRLPLLDVGHILYICCLNLSPCAHGHVLHSICRSLFLLLLDYHFFLCCLSALTALATHELRADDVLSCSCFERHPGYSSPTPFARVRSAIGDPQRRGVKRLRHSVGHFHTLLSQFQRLSGAFSPTCYWFVFTALFNLFSLKIYNPLGTCT